ncbi:MULTISPECIES: hypothetical protein [unclassified Arthrobacter]|uniref:hypothetical protein n=1 Tax=unclassified Arthrobacter TaxID=235627 RepID=UPI001C6119AB|nr:MULTISPECIES: hypothetical protein [unclassified Arthrobacter]
MRHRIGASTRGQYIEKGFYSRGQKVAFPKQVFMVARAKSTGAGGCHIAASHSDSLCSGSADKRQLCKQCEGNSIRNTHSDAQQGHWHGLYN